MEDGLDVVFFKNLIEQGAVGRISKIKTRRWRDCPARPRGKPVDDNDLFPGIEQSPHHVASYITGPTRDQNSHDITSLFAFLEPIKANNSSSLITCTANTQPIPHPIKKVAYDWLAQ
ncbi:conserved hypothetical protein [Agrobacterium fabrum str. J-07]|nr:conserved hypothetical protein [Agrobacterium fabrum str. J-07]